MSDSFTTVTSESWLSRIVGSIVGVLFGALMIVASVPLLFWNEGRAVHTAKSLTAGAATVVSVPADRVDPANEGHLVYTSGTATTTATLTDPDFGVTAPAIRLDRKAEMYQWREEKHSETRKKLGGGTETVTTYSYDATWSPTLVNSSSFHEAEGHANPESMPIAKASWTAPNVTLGAFTLSNAQLAKLDHTEALSVARPSPTLPTGVRASSGGYYRGDDPASPKVGDERITFEVVQPAPISLIARQVGNSFEADQSTGAPILLVSDGTVSANDMFKVAETQNTAITWGVRAGGFVLMLIGFILVFRPLVTLGDVVPFVGSILGAGLFMVAFCLALMFSCITIGIAWVAYRPLLGIALIVGAIAAVVLLRQAAGSRKAAAPVAAAKA